MYKEVYKQIKKYDSIVIARHVGADLDALSELRFWLDDSQRVLNDETLDDMAKIKYLPKRELAIKIEEETYTKRYNLKNCKMIENRSNEKAPYLFVLMIEKIIEG